ESRLMRSIWLMFTHRLDEAEEELKRVIAADPLLAVGSMTLGQVYLYMDQASRALQPIQAALELAPDLGYAREQLVHAYIALGRLDDAIVEARRAAAPGGTREIAVLAYALARARRLDEAHAVLRALTETPGTYLPPAHIAMVYSALDLHD